MREILFRGKTTPKDVGEFNNIWVYGDLIRSGDKYYIHPQANRVKVDGELGQIIVMHEVIPETVSQWTGLVDKNGVKIFEGDVVKYEGLDLSVQWNITHGSYILLHRDPATGLAYFHLYEDEASYMEVIGNEWDNPELVSE